VQIVRAACAVRSFADLLNGWYKQANEDSDNGNNDQQFDERESSMNSRSFHGSSPKKIVKLKNAE
jgi:hypothetical protein